MLADGAECQVPDLMGFQLPLSRLLGRVVRFTTPPTASGDGRQGRGWSGWCRCVSRTRVTLSMVAGWVMSVMAVMVRRLL